jgi:hypothetical protein
MPGVSAWRLSLDDCQLTLASPRDHNGNIPASGGPICRSSGRPRCGRCRADPRSRVCRRIPSRCLARRARRGPGREGCRARPGARSWRRAAGRRSRRHERPIRRRDRARSSRSPVACEAAAACCRRCRTTPRRPVPAFSSASSDVGWTTELRSAAGSLVMSSFASLPTQARPNGPFRAKCRRWADSGRGAGRPTSTPTGVSARPIGRPYR